MAQPLNLESDIPVVAHINQLNMELELRLMELEHRQLRDCREVGLELVVLLRMGRRRRLVGKVTVPRLDSSDSQQHQLMDHHQVLLDSRLPMVLANRMEHLVRLMDHPYLALE